jgi:UvrB/uvrC motif
MKTKEEPKCTKCGRKGLTLTIVANMATGEKGALCTICLRSDKKRSLKEIDDELKEYEKLEVMYTDLIKSIPKMPEVPDGLSAYAMTPLSAYKSIQAMIAHLKTERMELITQEGSKERLQYELNLAIESEDFEKAAEIKAQLEAL